MTIQELCDEWLETYHKDQIKRQTYVKYKCLLDNYILPGLGPLDAETLTRRDVKSFVNHLKQATGARTGRPLSASTINSCLTVLKLVYAYAVDFEITTNMPTERVKGAKKSRPEKVKCFTVSEQRAIENYCTARDSADWFGIILCLYTGLRIGELLALEWSDINFKTGILSVNKTKYVSRDENGNWVDMIDTPKTRCSAREIPLPAFILVKLADFKRRSLGPCIVANQNGSPMDGRLYRARYDKMLQELGIRHISFHALRHTFATRAVELGIDVKTVADILGHANPSITLAIYAHALDEHKKTAMSLFKPLAG